MTAESSEKKSAIFIVDDDPLVLKALCQTVQVLGQEIKGFSNPAECIGALRHQVCSLLITDVNMPVMNGIELLRAAKKIQPLMPVLVITGYGDIPLAVEAVKAGAFNFVEKPIDEETFIPLLRSALSTATSTDPLSAQALSDLEVKVLKLLALGLSNKQIAYELDRSIRTVENYRHRMMRKLNVSSSAEMVRIAVDIGLVEEKD